MGLKPITAAGLRGIRHGFFTRQGGVSKGIYEGLNGGQGSADDPKAVAENRELIRAHLGAGALVSVAQIHSPLALTVKGDWSGERPDADAMVTDVPGQALGVLSADCAPVLFADPEAGVIGAAHAGWKGAISGVLEATVDLMVHTGAARDSIVAVVGPVISQRAYEVGPEFVDRFLDDDIENGRFFAGGQGIKAMFDLPGFCLHRLREAGVGRADWTGHCTYTDKRQFYSYRRSCHQNEPDYGRLVAAVVL